MMPETATDMVDPQHASTAARPLAAARITRWACILASLLLVVLLVPLAGHAYLGAFSRYIADDFCTASSLRHMGGLAEIGEDRAEWINVCIAGAYDVGAVVAK